MLRSIAVIAGAIVLAGCSTAGPEARRAERMGGGAPGPAAGFSQASRLVDHQRYEAALPILRCVAGQGHGYEIAQYLAGYSLIRLADAENTPEIMRPEHMTEGFERLEVAAAAGWGAAQAELAQAYWDVGTPEALQRGLYWTNVYRRNSRDRAYGIDRISDTLEGDLSAAVGSTDRASIQAEAATYSVQPMQAETLTPECAQLVRDRGAGAGTRQRAQQRSGRGGGRGGQGGRGGPGIGADVD